MLRTSANGLHGSPHVLVSLHQVPASAKEPIPFELSAIIDTFCAVSLKIEQHLAPCDVTITLHYNICRATLKWLFREQRCMDAAINDRGPALMCHHPDSVTSQGIACMHADADHVSAVDRIRVQRLE